jgi:hypothetical protein
VGDPVSLACMLVRVSPVHRLPLIPFSLGHYSLPESCFPYPLQGLCNPLFMPCLPLCLLYQLQGVVADTEPFLIVSAYPQGYPRPPHCLFLASVGFPLPLASFCLLPYLSMKQFSSIFLPLSSRRHRSTKGSVKNKLFATVPDSRINSWESWFIFNQRKINTNQYYKSDSLNARNCNMIRECMTLQDDKCIIITVHT